MLNYELLIKKAIESGFQNIEIIENQKKSLNISVFDGKIDKNKISASSLISIRAMYNDKMSNIVVEDHNFDLDEILKILKNNALSIESEEKNDIYEGDKLYPEVEINNYDFDKIPTSKKIDLLLNIEKKSKELDDRIVKVSDCMYFETSTSFKIINSKGLNVTKNFKYCYAGVGVVATQDGDTQNAYNIEAKKTFDELDCDTIASKAVKKAVAMFNAKQVKTDKYKIIFENEAMSSIFTAFHSIFSGDAAIKKVTPLLGKENEKVFSDKITIIDNPLLKEALEQQPFDDEGVACYEKVVVKNGVLNTLLHSLKTAKYFNKKSTGNGFASGRGISARGANFYIEKGSKSKEELIESLDKGLLITEVEGLHSGVNPISGDFSIKASGFYIEGGKINRPANLLVISGNFINMMNNVIEVGSDIEINGNDIFTPSILFEELPVSGE